MAAEEKIFLNVRFKDKDQVKKLGAKWDSRQRGWWISDRQDRQEFIPWLPLKYRPGAEPPYIVSELIPAPTWYQNLRSFLSKEEWDRLRRDCYDRAGKRCEVCGGRGPKWPVECDEQWEFIEDSGSPGIGIQKLAGLAALCPDCHAIRHLGKAQIDGRLDRALGHLAFVNGWTGQEAEDHAAAAFAIWERRSAMTWHLELTVLAEMGVDFEQALAAVSVQLGSVDIGASLTRSFGRYAGLPKAQKPARQCFNEAAKQTTLTG